MTTVVPLVCFLFLIAISCPSAAAQEMVAEGKAPTSDLLALLQLKDSFTNAGSLSSWSANGSLPCKWTAVFCTNNVIIGLNLASIGLSGKIDIDALAKLKGLRAINLKNNSFSGPLPAALSRLGSLKSIYLSGNKFSGSIPSNLFASMRHLKKLWLDHNDFSGPVPSSLANLAYLMELRLDDNAFEGAIPDFSSKALKTFNAANNKLSGPIPASLAHFDDAAFQGNIALCGAPLSHTPCSTTPPPSTPASSEMASSEKESGSGKMAVILVIAALLLFALVAALVTNRQRQRDKELNTLGADVADAEAVEAASQVPASFESSDKQTSVGSSHKRSGSNRYGSAGVAEASGSAGDLVMVNEEKGVFDLADLMKASAEVLGNGGLGSAYKAVMDSGLAVAVKRMREMDRVGKDAFEEQIRRLGRLRHPNVLTPLAFHYRKGEKLIVFEYVPRGSLLYILHGDQGPDHMALDWPTRLKIMRGIAGGMAYLHCELAALDAPHGNLRSANVLLGPAFEPLLVDYGLLGLVNQSQAPHVLFAYKSPEALQDRHVSPKSDVYCLGVVILEVLTGKFPSQYLNNTKGGTDVVQWTASAIVENREAELLDPAITEGNKVSEPVMVRLLQLGAACANTDPDERPDMEEVVRLIEEIAGGDADQAKDVDGGPFGPLPSLKDCHADVGLGAPEPAPEGMGRDGSTGGNFPFHAS